MEHNKNIQNESQTLRHAAESLMTRLGEWATKCGVQHFQYYDVRKDGLIENHYFHPLLLREVEESIFGIGIRHGNDAPSTRILYGRAGAMPPAPDMHYFTEGWSIVMCGHYAIRARGPPVEPSKIDQALLTYPYFRSKHFPGSIHRIRLRETFNQARPFRPYLIYQTRSTSLDRLLGETKRFIETAQHDLWFEP